MSVGEEKPAAVGVKAVLFDLDGTLLDTLGDLSAALNRALAQMGLPQHPVSAVRYFVGEGARLLCERALPEDRRDAETLEALYHRFAADYAENWAVTTKPYPGIAQLLKGLRERGVRLAVLSNKPHRYMAEIEAHYFAGCGFEHFYGQRDGVQRKPHPEGALLAAREMGLKPESFLYLGDSGVDMQTATGAGMRACGALWGYREEPELVRTGADCLAAHPEDVLAYV